MIPAAPEQKPIDWQFVERVIVAYCEEVGREKQGIDCAKNSSELRAKLNEVGLYPVPRTGAYITTKVWKRDHAWLELGGKIIDVMHSQFGVPDWLITDVGEPYIPTSQNPDAQRGSTEIHLLYFDGCPNVDEARRHLRAALAQAGREPKWTEVNLRDSGVPDKWRGFPSPTVLIDGKDTATGADSATGSSACRLGGAPSVEAIAARLKGPALGSPSS